jgi:ankyrin repeat protein
LIKAKANLNVANLDGKNPLALHIIRGNPVDIEVLKLLIGAGINVNYTNDPGWSALMHACYN